MPLLLIIAVVLLLGGTVMGELIVQDPGYVLISFQGTSIETSIWGLALVSIFGFLATYFTLRLLAYLAGRRGKLISWSLNRGRQRAHHNTERGLIALAAGDWSRAQRLLGGAAKKSDISLVNYLGAAEAAHELNQPEASDELLQTALRQHPKAEVAIGLLQAQHMLSRDLQETALATLLRLRRKSPKHKKVLRLLIDTYQQLQDWGALADLLPDLRRHKALKEEELSALERDTHLARLNQILHKLPADASAQEKSTALGQVWNALPKSLADDEDLISCYSSLLCDTGAFEQAEKLLRGQLKKRWNPQLVSLLGTLPSRDSRKQLKQAQSWLSAHPDDSALLLTLGRLAMRNHDWEQAQKFFQQSLVSSPSQETFNELSRLLLHLEDEAGYQQLLADNIDGLVRDLPALPLPILESATPVETAIEAPEPQDAEVSGRGA